MIVRTMQFLEGKSPSSFEESAIQLQFTDLGNQSWLIPYLKYAVENNMIENRNYFYPRTKLTKSALAAILYDAPLIQTKLNEQKLVGL